MTKKRKSRLTDDSKAKTLANMSDEEISDLMGPTLDAFKQAISVRNDLAKSIQAPLQEFADMNKMVQAQLKPMQSITAAMKEAMSATSLVQQVMDAHKEQLAQFQGLVIDLPTASFVEQLRVNTKLTFELESFRQIKPQDNSFNLQSNVTEVTEYKQFSLELHSKVDMRLTTLEAKVDKTNDQIEYLVEDSKRKDNQLQDLVQFIRSNDGSTFARIENVAYRHRGAKLIIDDIDINVRPATNQGLLAQVIFSDMDAVQKEWQMEEIVDALHEDPEYVDDWRRKFYDAAYQLNKKIAAATGKQEFLIITKRSISVNPRYVS